MEKYIEVSIADLNDTFDKYTSLINDIIDDVVGFCFANFYDELKCIGRNDLNIHTSKRGKINFDLSYKKTYIEYTDLVMYRNEAANKKDFKNKLQLFADEKLLHETELLNRLLLHKINFKIQPINSNIKSEIKREHEMKGRHICDSLFFTPNFIVTDTFDLLNKFPSTVLVKLHNYKDYNKLVDFMEKLNIELTAQSIFSDDGSILDKYKNKTLETYDLSNINFDNKNISGIDISKNREVHINFDKIVKDLTDSSINGYNLNKYTFRNYNLTNTDLRNTGATIDIGSCIINKSGKMCSGTLFDENNKLIFGEQVLTNEDISKLGIKIYKKEMR